MSCTFIHTAEFCSLICGNACVKDLAYISVHDFVKLVHGKSDTMVGNTSLREIVGPYLLGAVPCSDLTASHLSFGIMLFLLLDVVELGLKECERLCLILEL